MRRRIVWHHPPTTPSLHRFNFTVVIQRVPSEAHHKINLHSIIYSQCLDWGADDTFIGATAIPSKERCRQISLPGHSSAVYYRLDWRPIDSVAFRDGSNYNTLSMHRRLRSLSLLPWNAAKR